MHLTFLWAYCSFCLACPSSTSRFLSFKVQFKCHNFSSVAIFPPLKHINCTFYLALQLFRHIFLFLLRSHKLSLGRILGTELHILQMPKMVLNRGLNEASLDTSFLKNLTQMMVAWGVVRKVQALISDNQELESQLSSWLPKNLSTQSHWEHGDNNSYSIALFWELSQVLEGT